MKLWVGEALMLPFSVMALIVLYFVLYQCRKAVIIYSALGVLFIFAGTLVKNDLVWELQDMFNQLMVLPNILALLALSKIVTASAVKHKE